MLVGRRLLGFRVTLISLVLDFGEQGDDPGTYTMWIYADEVGFAGTDGRDDQRHARTSAAAALSLHALLGRELREVDVAEGRLRLVLSDAAEVSVEPEPDSQAWALIFEIGELIECNPGGALSVRLP